MTGRPILFSSPMVLALLAGTKTRDSRLIDFPGIEKVMDFVKVATDKQGRPVYEMKDAGGQFVSRPAGKNVVDYHFSPRIGVGDRLWVRETLVCNIDWGLFYDAHGRIGPSEEHFLKDERANAIVERYCRDDETLWNVPSIFVPRWASRLTLTVTDVRIQRLHAIDLKDARAEGCEISELSVLALDRAERDQLGRQYFGALWESINGAGSWAKNPWVTAYTFTVDRRNIDEAR